MAAWDWGMPSGAALRRCGALRDWLYYWVNLLEAEARGGDVRLDRSVVMWAQARPFVLWLDRALMEARAASRIVCRMLDGLPPAGLRVPPVFWTRAQAARALGVPCSSVASWTARGWVRPRYASAGAPCYGPAEMDRLRVIRVLRRSRYGARWIGRMLDRLDMETGVAPSFAPGKPSSGEPSHGEDILRALRQRIRALRTVRAYLAAVNAELRQRAMGIPYSH